MISLVFATMRRIRTMAYLFSCRKILSAGDDLHIGGRARLWAPNQIAIGNQVYLGKEVHIEANCRIGNFCLIANRVSIIGRHDHDFGMVGFPMRYSPWISSVKYPSKFRLEEAVIGDDVWIGFASIVLTGTTIGKGSVVAAGSVVTKDVPPYSIVAGVPARVVGRRFENDADIARHELSLLNGSFKFSERGYDSCIIDPYISKDEVSV